MHLLHYNKILICYWISLCVAPSLYSQESILTREEVLELLPHEKATSASHFSKLLIDYKDLAYPAFLTLLNDPEQPDWRKRLIISILIHQPNQDRSRFIDVTISFVFQNQDQTEKPIFRMREFAIKLLSQIGTNKESVIGVILLDDSNRTIVYHAATFLARIGTEYEEAVLEQWLIQHPFPYYCDLDVYWTIRQAIEDIRYRREFCK